MKKEVTYPLVPGKAIGAQRGFASTFNWMRNFCLNLSGGPGVTVDRTDSDHPVIRIGVEQPGIAPFAVRLHKTDGDQTGLWEIYLPAGCCNVGGTCEPLNPPASDTSGHEDDDLAWRSLGRINFGNFDPGSVPAAPKVNAIVEIHVKPSVKVFGVDNLDNTVARRVIWASVRDQNLDDYWRDKRGYEIVRSLYRDKPGDVLETDVAALTATKNPGDDEWGISISPLRSTSIVAAVPQGTGVSNFDLVWVLATEPRSGGAGYGLELVVKKLLCIRQLAAAAGISITGDTMTDVVSDVNNRAVKIYARIDVTDLTGGAQIVKVLKDPEGVSISSPYVVWLPLYETMFNAVTSDYRSQSLTNLQLFHA